MVTISKLDFPKILFIYDHNFLRPMTPLDPRVKYLTILRHINQIRENIKHKKLSIHWLASHSFPSVPFIEAISMLGEERFAKSIKYYKFVEIKTGSIISKRNQFMNLFSHLERQLANIKDRDSKIQLFILDDLYELSKWNKKNKFGSTLFYNTLCQIIEDPDCYIICLSKSQITDWVDQLGNRKVRAAHHEIIRKQGLASQMEIKFQWLIRPPSTVKLKTEHKKGTDTIVSLILTPQNKEEFDEFGYKFTQVMDFPEAQVCDINLGIIETPIFAKHKKEEIINSSISLIQNYQIPVEMERKFNFEEIIDIDKYRIYRNPNLTNEFSQFRQKINRKSDENSKLISFVKYSLKSKSIRELENLYLFKHNNRKSAIRGITGLIKECETIYVQDKTTSDHLIEEVMNIYYELLQLDQNEIFYINEIGDKYKKWVKSFLALFTYEVHNLYKHVDIEMKDVITIAIQYPQIRNWLNEYKSSNTYFNKFDAKKAISLARKLPHILTIVHPRFGVSYLKLDQTLLNAPEGELEILRTKVEGDDYFIWCRLSLYGLDPITSYTIGIGESEFKKDNKILLPSNFSTTISISPGYKLNEYPNYEMWKVKIIRSEFSEFKKPIDLQEKEWNKPSYLKLYISEIDVVIELHEEGEDQYKWKIHN